MVTSHISATDDAVESTPDACNCGNTASEGFIDAQLIAPCIFEVPVEAQVYTPAANQVPRSAEGQPTALEAINHDEPLVATCKMAVTEGIQTICAGPDLGIPNDAKFGNEEQFSDPYLAINNADTTLDPPRSNDDNISEDSPFITNFSNAGHPQADLDGFTPVRLKKNRGNCAMPPNETPESKQLFYEVGYTSHPMITRSQSRRPQNEDDYYIYPVDARLDSPHKLAMVLARYRSSKPEAKTYQPYLRKAIQFHNRYNRSISATVGIPSKNFNC
ncbi:unnamed protein product [Cuscuta europaea]|uniref:Uncharacterized protein n=1 Tax=Cuscuta europaea TaxID=41803 RepID=A0A9P1EJG7_CUSEU|nr:unnamed protein product [Cuscuta europaea]